MADESLTENATDLSKLKVPDLKKELKQRGLSTTGNKTELIERLQAALKSNENISSESVDDLEEDLLNDEDDEQIDANESVILDNDLEETPTEVKPIKRKIEEDKSDEVKTGPPKKVILNRNSSTNSNSDSEKTPEDKKETQTTTDKNEEKKVVKLSELTAKERLEMRAKKFGVSTISVDAKKAVRAERFGIGSTSADSITSSRVNTNLDILKQRAARFGGSVSTAMTSLENKQKLEKRKERFASSSSNKTTNGVTDSEKAKLRLERFKEPVK